MSTSDEVLLEAKFIPNVRRYWLFSGIIVLLATIIGIPLLLLWIPLGIHFTQKYLDRMECILTRKTLVLRKGIFNRIEKTVPLEKITDLGLQQGPIMRYYGVHNLTVETAGQSAVGALLSICGIENVTDFREAVLEQRDKLYAKEQKKEAMATDENRAEPSMALLEEIRDILKRIEEKVGE